MPDERLNLATMVAPGGYFLRRPTRESVPFTAQPRPGPYEHRFSYRDSDPSIRESAIDLIRGARRKIFLASFRIGDAALLDALFEAVERLRGGVYVITSWTDAGLRRGLAALEDNPTADEAAQRHRFEELTRRGVFVRGHDQCHAKFLVVDDEAALVSSANLETSALADRPHRKVTGESGVVLSDAAEVNRLARLFTRLWYAGCRHEARPGAEYALAPREPTASPTEPTLPEPGPRPGVIWTHDDERLILRTVHDIVDRARSELLLATFGLRGLTQHVDLLHERIAAARGRGVEVTLLCRGRNNIAEHRREATALAELGVRVVGDSLTHAKAAIADGRHGALFSANFDSEHGLTSGVEVGVRLDGLPALAEARRYLLHAIDHADLTFAVGPTQARLDASFGAQWRRPWAGSRTVSVVADEADWRALATATPPVLYAQRGDLTRLYANGGEWLLENGKLRIVRAPTRGGATLDLMNTWWGERDTAERRGFFPAELVRVSAT